MTAPDAKAGVFDSGATVSLGAGNPFTNEGVLSPGALLNVFTTNETGNFVQTMTGSCGSFGAPTTACGYLATDLQFSNQTSDRLNVTGTAAVSGAVVVSILNAGMALPGAHDVTLVSAVGGAAMPGLALQSQPTAVATYMLAQPNPNDVNLHYVIDFSPAGLTQNQHAVGNAINAIQTARIPTFAPIAAAIFYQPNVAALGQVYDSISGEGVAEAEQTAFAMNDRFQSAVMREMDFWLFDDENDDPNAKVLGTSALSYVDDADIGSPAFANVKTPMAWPQPRTWRAWAVMYGGTSNNPANPYVGSAATTESDGGAAFGLDYQIDPHAIVGVAGGYNRANFGVLDRATGGTVEGGQIALYGSVRGENAYLAGLLGGDFNGNNERRFASIPGTVLPPLFGTFASAIGGFAENPAGAFASNAFSGQFETGYRNHLGAGVDLTPFAGMQFAVLRMDGFTETNGGLPSTIGLNYMGRTIASVPSFLGVQLSRKIDLGGDMKLSFWARAAWKHEFEPLRSIEAGFIAAPGFNFIVNGASAISDMARVDAGMKVAVSKNLEFFASFDGDFAPQGRDIAGSGGVRVNW